MSAIMDYDNLALQIAPEARLPSNKLRLNTSTQILKKSVARYYPTNTGSSWTTFSANANPTFTLGSSNRSMFWSPSESYIQVSVKLLDANDAPLNTASFLTGSQASSCGLVFGGSHTLVKGFEVSHALSSCMIEQVSDGHDVMVMSSLASLPKSTLTSLSSMIGSTILNRVSVANQFASATASLGPLKDSGDLANFNEGQLACNVIGNNRANVGTHLRYNPNDVLQTTTAISSSLPMTLLLGSSFLNNDSLIPMSFLPLNVNLTLQDVSVWLTELSGTIKAATANDAASFTPGARKVYNYQYKMEYICTTYMLDEDSVNEVESLIANDAFVIDYERCMINSSNIQPSEVNKSITLNSLKMNSLNRSLVTFVRSSALNNIYTNKYLFTDGSSASDASSALKSFMCQIGDQVFPSYGEIKCNAVNGDYHNLYMFTKMAHSNGENISLQPDSDDLQSYFSRAFHNDSNESHVIENGKYYSAANTNFHAGCSWLRNSSIQSGINASLSSLSFTFNFGAQLPETLVAYICLFYSAELHCGKNAVFVSY